MYKNIDDYCNVILKYVDLLHNDDISDKEYVNYLMIIEFNTVAIKKELEKD